MVVRKIYVQYASDAVGSVGGDALRVTRSQDQRFFCVSGMFHSSKRKEASVRSSHSLKELPIDHLRPRWRQVADNPRRLEMETFLRNFLPFRRFSSFPCILSTWPPPQILTDRRRLTRAGNDFFPGSCNRLAFEVDAVCVRSSFRLFTNRRLVLFYIKRRWILANDYWRR